MTQYLKTCVQHFCLLGASLCIAIVACGCGPEKTPLAGQPENKLVTVREVKLVISEESLAVSGTLEAHKTATLNFQVPGKVEQIRVDEGDHVSAGQVLASLDFADYSSQLEIAEAAVMRAQDAYDRFEPLCREGAFAESKFVELKSGLTQALAARDIAHKRLRDTELKSPVSGIVGMKKVEIGQIVSPELPVFVVVKTDTVFARVAVPESEVGKIAIGHPAEVTIPALNDWRFDGKISLIGVVADPRTRSFTVKVRLANPEYHLRPGMIVQTVLSTHQSMTRLTVPVEAIVRDADDLSYVFTIGPGQRRARRQRVDPGGLLQSEVEISSGLRPGDLVVVGGQHKLDDGDLVTIESH